MAGVCYYCSSSLYSDAIRCVGSSSTCEKDGTLSVQIVCELVDVLKRHQLQSAGAHFIAHSFGTQQSI